MSTPEPYRLQVAKGQIEGATSVRVYGVNPDIDSSTEETIMWTDGSRLLQPYPSSEQTMYVSSTSNNDDGDSGNQTGVRTIRLTGLDGNYDLVSEDITMQGQTQVATTNTYLRVFKIVTLTVGSNGHQFGNIYVADSGASGGTPTGTYYLRMSNSAQAMNNTSSNAVYTVPAGHTLYVDLIQFKTSMAGNFSNLVNCNFVTRPAGTDTPFQSLLKHSFREPVLDFPFIRPLAITEKTDIECRGTIEGSGNNDVSATFTGILVKN